MRSIEWRDGDILVVDQSKLPHVQEHLTLRSTEDIIEAIALLRVRGAPALGIIAAYGMAQAAVRTISSSARRVFEAAEEAGTRIAETRPTAVNMSWAVGRMLAAARPLVATAGPARLRNLLVDEARAIHREDEEACEAMARHAAAYFRPEGVVLTHCNTGSLVTGGIGTALGAIRRAYENGIELVVLATETRPLLQGARLTAWELGRLGIPHALVVDSAAPSLIARGEVSMVMVGADRIAANGDTANKVGTYPLALAAASAGVPFIVVAPTSTVDLDTASGVDIEVEERSAREVTTIMGTVESAPYGTDAINPAFDVTPGELISAIITERGVAEPPYSSTLPAIAASARRRVHTRAVEQMKPARTAPKRAKPKPSPKGSKGAKGGSAGGGVARGKVSGSKPGSSRGKTAGTGSPKAKSAETKASPKRGSARSGAKRAKR